MLRRLLVCLSLILFTAGLVNAVEFSADTVTKFKGGEETSGKIYYKPDRFRMETKVFQDMIVITRLDKKVVWNIMPAEKIYMEMPFDMSNKPKVEEKFEGEIERKEVGRERIDGHPTIKYLITYKADNRKDQVYQWMATDINFPVKTAAVDGSWTQEFRNIKTGSQPGSLFEVPSGYQKMQMPQLPGGMNLMPMK